MEKRKDYISWDDFFIGVAELASKRSKDPNKQVGACIVNPENKILGTGYNGMPNGCSDDELPWAKYGSKSEVKYSYIVHAELNAILNSSVSLKGCTIYVSLFPCNECAKAIIQSGIKEVVYISDKYHDQEVLQISKRLLDMAGIKIRQIKK